MCVKLSPGDLNPSSCPPHPTSTYTCEMTTAPKVHGGIPVLTDTEIYRSINQTDTVSNTRLTPLLRLFGIVLSILP